MSTVYVREQGAVVRRQGERLRVTRNNEQLLDLPLLHVDQLVVFGNVQLTSQAVAMLLQKEVDVVFLSLHGKFRGRLVHTGSKFAELRHAQLQKMSRETAALEIARQVVIGKLHNQRFLLETLPAEPPQPPTLKPAGRGIGEMMVKAGSARSVDSLRGYEGRAGAVYWGAFATLLPPALGFQGRKYFPPPDPVNGLLSFGYSLLLKDVSAAVQLVGLDPYLGFFHTIDYGRPSLALDMMEEFRPGLVDAVVLGLARAGDVAVTDFEQTGNPKLPLRMKPAMMDRLINAYEAGVNRKMYHPEAGGETALRRIIELQVRRLARLMLNQAKKYGPFLMKPPAGGA